MKRDKRIILSITWGVIGTILICLGVAEKIDAFWSGAGSGLLVVCIMQLLRFYRINKDEEYREKKEIELRDERNRFIRNKAWAWSGYLFVMISSVSCIVFKLIGQDLLSIATSGSACLVLVLFWVSYAILKRKY